MGSKNNKNSKKLLDIYDKGKNIIIKNGTLSEINHKWSVDENY